MPNLGGGYLEDLHCRKGKGLLLVAHQLDGCGMFNEGDGGSQISICDLQRIRSHLCPHLILSFLWIWIHSSHCDIEIGIESGDYLIIILDECS